MDNLLRECGCFCANPESVSVVSATVTGTVATLTINRELSGLSFFKLFVPCSIISSIPDVDTIVFTDGTLSYPGQNWLGNLLRNGTLKKVYCGCRCECRCDVCLLCFSGNDAIHIQILNRIV